jgi:hypothetical protein
LQKDGVQVDLEHFFLVRAGKSTIDANAGRVGVFGQATGTLEKLDDGLRPLIRKSPATSLNLADYIDNLAIESEHFDRYRPGFWADKGMEMFGGLTGG